MTNANMTDTLMLAPYLNAIGSLVLLDLCRASTQQTTEVR